MEEKSQRFRVIIVGGSVAGLTLAHCLWKSGIDFIVLEAYREMAPQAGASIGILPNGARILDQLGMFDDVLNAVEPLQHSSFWADSGKLIMSSNAPRILQQRHGYPINFLDRQTLLGILYMHLGECRNKVLVNKKVTQVIHRSSHIVAECGDGSSYQGDLVVGADGVHSNVRQEMWKHMVSQGLSKEIEPDMKAMVSEYDCVFGISPKTPGLVPGHTHRTFGDGYSFLTISSKNGRVYWFFFTKMARKYHSHEIPRFDAKDVDKHVAPWLHKPLSGNVSFRDVFQKAYLKTHLPLEEASREYWTNDRFVCIGDAIHKMTPNAGQGGNTAIESAATLANSISKLLQEVHSPQIEDIRSCLRTWQKCRRPRVTKIWISANDLTRLEASATLKHRLIGQYMLPYLKTLLLDKSSADFVGAAKLDSLPLPARSLQATMPYTNQTIVVDETSLWKRVVLCIPLFSCYDAARATMTPVIANVRPFMIPFIANGSWTSATGEALDLHKPLYPIPFLDRLFKPLILCFLPSISGADPVSVIQMRSLMIDVNAMYAIWLMESYRNCPHSYFDSLLPILIGSAFQLKGIGLWAPIYYSLEYLRTPLTKLLSGTSHLVDAGSIISLLVASLAAAYLPTYMNFTASTLDSRRSWNALWQLFPVVVPVLTSASSRLTKTISKRGDSDGSNSVQKRSKIDLFWVRTAYVGLAAISGSTWIHGLRSAPANLSIQAIFWPGYDGHTTPVTSFEEGIARFLQYDQLLALGSSFVWLVLRFYELSRVGASFSGKFVASTLIGAAAAFGPGAAFILGWGWKEEIIHRLSLLVR